VRLVSSLVFGPFVKVLGLEVLVVCFFFVIDGVG